MQNNKLKPPKNTNLPFFAYGIFKPHQIAYPRIKNYVKTYHYNEINYEMLMRDGVPLITATDNKNKKTKGYLINFNDKKAYEIISETHYDKLYRWEEIKVDKNKANVLMGANPEMGSEKIENKIGDYNGRDDIYFNEAIKTIENELNDEDKRWHQIDDFLKLQMSYLLLWMSIERYVSLKYNDQKIADKWKSLANEEVFKESLKKHVKSRRTVYSAKDLWNYTLNPNEPLYSIKYYYTIRCNVAHRGKALYNDDKIIRKSLKELLEIFKDVIDDAFDC